MKSKYDFSKAKKGKRAKEVKISKTIRLDADVLEWLGKQVHRNLYDSICDLRLP